MEHPTAWSMFMTEQRWSCQALRHISGGLGVLPSTKQFPVIREIQSWGEASEQSDVLFIASLPKHLSQMLTEQQETSSEFK